MLKASLVASDQYRKPEEETQKNDEKVFQLQQKHAGGSKVDGEDVNSIADLYESTPERRLTTAKSGGMAATGPAKRAVSSLI